MNNLFKNFCFSKFLTVLGVFANLAVFSGCQTIVNSVQGAPVKEIYPGQTVIGSLNKEKHSSIKVRSVMQTAPPGYVFSKTGQSWLLDNKYSSETTYSGTAEIWKINTEFLDKPTAFILGIQGKGFMPIAMIFDGATEKEVLNSDKEGFSIAPAPSVGSNVLAGAYLLEPKKTYYMTVQAQDEPVDAIYEVVLRPY